MPIRKLLCALFLLFAGFAAAQTRAPLPVPDLPGYKTLKGDFHLHSVFSDGRVWPTIHLMEAWRDGLDVISFTEHADYHPNSADVKIDGKRSYAIAAPLAQQLGIILIPGAEITKQAAHFNALFVTDPDALNIGTRNDSPLEPLRRARAQNAFIFWNHPPFPSQADNRSRWTPPVAAAYEEKLFQGMELVNGATFYEDAYPWIEEKKLTILANSDAHEPLAARDSGNVRPITLIFARTADAAGVREAFQARRTAAWSRGEVWGAEEHLRGLWTGAVKVEDGELSWRPGASYLLRLRNSSAIPFRARVVQAPAWFRVEGGFVAPEAISLLRPYISRDAPAGLQRFELELEITNLHTGPGRNLVARLPLSINISRNP